jgi:hypothetical protein
MPRWTVRTLWLAGSLMAACTPQLWAQATVELKAGSRNVYVREAVELSLEVSNFQDCEPPTIPDILGAVVRQLGGASEMSQTSIINGRLTQSHSRTYSFELTPQKVGELVIPPIPVHVDGKVLMTRELRLTVRPSDADQLFAIDVTAGRSRIYVGQRVPLTMTIWVKPSRYAGQLLPPEYMLRLVRPVQFAPFPIPAQVKSMSRRARPGGDPSSQFYAYEFVTDYVPDKPGPLTFDIEAGIEYPANRGSRNLRAQANVEPAEVLPVPMEDRPPDFAGAVGLFAIDVTASPLSVRVGDPIDVTIELYGEGPVETLPPPLLSANERLNDDFRLPSEQLAGEMHESRRRFKLTIRAKRDDVTEIPAIEYPYFDPDAERFVIARSKPIPLTVAPAAEVAAPQMATAQRPPGANASALQALDGLRDIETSESALLTTHASIKPALVASVMFVPPAVFLLAWAALTYFQSRTADPARRRRQTALRTARRRIAQTRALAVRARSTGAGSGPANLAAEITTALSGYLADRFNEPPARFAGVAAVDFLRTRGVRDDLVDRWASLIERCQETSFAGGAQADGEALTRQALDCLTMLERQRL